MVSTINVVILRKIALSAAVCVAIEGCRVQQLGRELAAGDS
jgi:hypothetical protein